MAKFSASATIDRFSVGEGGINLFLRGSTSSRVNDEKEEYILFRSDDSNSNNALLLKKDIPYKVSQEVLEKCFSEANLLFMQQQHIRSKFTIDDQIDGQKKVGSFKIVEWTVG